MANRIEIASTINDTKAEVRKKHLHKLGFDKITNLKIVDAYTLDMHLEEKELRRVSLMLKDPITQSSRTNTPHDPGSFSWAIEIGYLPGVTDNVATTVRQGVEDLLETKLTEDDGIYTSQITFLSGDLTREEVEKIANSLANPLIKSIQIKSHLGFISQDGMDSPIPRVTLGDQPSVDLVKILNYNDTELEIIGKKGIDNKDGTRRGPLALDLTYMHAIRKYFERQGRNPTDIELESIAQTWSEHCKHTIFADPIDEIKDGLYRTFIQGATNKIRKLKGNKDFCVSVFTDNSGAIDFDEDYLITDKAETHNTPTALDPKGGSITGMLGAIRDALALGLGAKPVINGYFFCFGNPNDQSTLYKGKNKTQKMLSPRRIMNGVIKGVNEGGNFSGIPTTQGGMIIEDRYRGKPLVFVRTGGLIPRESNGRPSHEKEAQPGDYIVMVGGRVGKDGIHGATFSSEALDEGSPATAVQIGDPITQKKLSDALIKEARDLGLYTSITDNGAGGLSCSVAEMAKESGGCFVELEKVPLKYQGLAPWEIWISESQERMTLSVPKEKWDSFSNLMERRGVEASIIGKFTNSGKCIVENNGEEIVNLDMEFLHNGLPPRPLTTTYTRPSHKEPDLPFLENLTDSLHSMLGRLNITSFEFISQQYDHEVQGGSVIKPLQGRGRINGDATVTRPRLDSQKAIVISQGINPSYSDLDTYHMAASAIDTAIRNTLAAGGNLEHLALMDNFCWCSSTEPERLGQLKAAVQACHDYSIEFKTPFISGKDSMFNDFKGYDENGNPTKISIPPTLLISSISVIEDAKKAISLDAKFAGDLVYVLGATYQELGGSEYYAMIGEQLEGEKFIGKFVPQVDAQKNKALYLSLSKAINNGIVASAQSIHKGGLAIALAKTAMGGMLGMDISLENLPGTIVKDDLALYSESQGRLIVTVAPQYQYKFEEIMKCNHFSKIGTVLEDNTFRIKGKKGNEIINTTTASLHKSYKSTFKEY